MKFRYLLLLILLSGCGALDNSRVAGGYVQAFQAISNILLGYENDLITEDLIKEIPFASQTLKIGKGPKGLMILESKNLSQKTWVSADAVYIIEENGKIVQTSGLTNNVKDLSYSVDFSELLDVDTESIFTYYKSFADPELQNLKLQARFYRYERKLTSLISQQIYLTLIEEHVTSSELGWKVINKYWVDDDSFIWKTEQTISPKLPKMYIEVTKKPS